MSNTTDTPITNRLQDAYAGDPSCADYRDALESTCCDLERQLAEARGQLSKNEEDEARLCPEDQSWQETLNTAIEQRDRLAEALRNISRQRASRYESTVGVVCNIADKALATLDRKEQTL